MREILFRGQTRRYGEKVRMGDGAKVPSHWVYGGVLQGVGSHSIIYGGENESKPSEGLDKWCVYTSTLGQYTGLIDKNGKKIFEGDIVRYFQRLLGGVDYEHKDPVLFLEGGFTVGVYFLNNWLRDCSNGNIQLEEIEVIGNIHDNPELQGGAENAN